MHDYVLYVVFAWVTQKRGNCIKTYIGITNNLTQRLRKHRGEIKGGAKFTKRYSKIGAEWKLAALLHGFQSQQEVLQVEWALQNPNKSRHFKSQPQTPRHDLAGILCNLIYFTRTKEYSKLWPTLHCLPEQTRQQLQIQRQVDLHCNPEPSFHSSTEYHKFKVLHCPTKLQCIVSQRKQKKANRALKNKKLPSNTGKSTNARASRNAKNSATSSTETLIEQCKIATRLYEQQLAELGGYA